MSNALAIGAVTATLKSLLENGLISQGVSSSLGGNPLVTVLPPDPESPNAGAQDRDRLNLFLYQTSPNSGWQNIGLPSRNSNGERLSNPPLALDLHYLLTAYSQNPFHAEILLGYGMQLLHETPILTREAIRTTFSRLSSSTDVTEKAIATAELAEQVEQIKICSQFMNAEEMSKLWSAIQTPYRPTAAYQVSVVLIESRRATKSALPVLERRLHVIPFRQPSITTVLPQIVTQGSQLTLQGQNLKADRVSVSFGSVEVNTLDTLSESQIQVTVPNGLQAGINTVRAIHFLDFGPPSGLHRGFESNVMPFVLRPRIVGVTASGGIVAGKVDVTLQVEPVIGKTQRVVLLLNEQTSSSGPVASYTVIADKRDADSNTLTIPASLGKAGNYSVRLQVDGAESLLDRDANNQYTGTPSVAIACSSNCLRSADISLTSTLAAAVLTVVGKVTIGDETNAPVPEARVEIAWTLPDGTARPETNLTGSTGSDRGVASFTIAGSQGTYELTVTNVAKPDFCFDPPQSAVLKKSITG